MIESMRLENFKNFRDATLSLGPLTVIVGTNASGKSNLRDAFRFVHGMSRGYTLAEIIGEKYVEGGVLQWKGIRGGIREVSYRDSKSFTIHTSIKGIHVNSPDPFRFIGNLLHSITVGLGLEKSGPVVERERFGTTAEYIFDSHPSADPPEQSGPPYIFARFPRGGDNRKLGKRIQFLTNQPIISQVEDIQQLQKNYRQPEIEFLKRLETMRFLDLSTEAMKLPSVPGQTVLGDRGENLSSVLQAICENPSSKNAVAEWIRELTPLDVVDFDFVPDQTGRILVTLIENNGQRTSAYSASDGTLRFLAMIAALLGPDSAKFYFLEEIDNGIHPTRLYLLLQLIEQQARDNKVQIVTTTHSPQLLGMLSDEAREHASLIYRLEGHSEGQIKRIMDIPEARHLLESRNLSRLHESGWLEDAVSFSETVEDAG